jgi:hypothetical protein
MHLIEVLLLLDDNERTVVPCREVCCGPGESASGHLTAFTRSPAQARREARGKTIRDEIVVFEAMTETLEDQLSAAIGVNFQQDRIIPPWRQPFL